MATDQIVSILSNLTP